MTEQQLAQDRSRLTVFVLERLVQHVVRVVIHAVPERRLVQVLLGNDAQLLAKVGPLLTRDLRGGRQSGNLLRDLDKHVGELVQAESAVLAAVLVKHVPERGRALGSQLGAAST